MKIPTEMQLKPRINFSMCYSPMQEFISLAFTEILEAWEAAVEIELISSLRQAG